MWGQDFTIGTCKYTVNSGGTTVSVSSANKNSTDAVVIPATVINGGKTYTVTSIAQKGFANAKMTAITIPASITSIGNEGLAYCSNLETVTFEEGIRLTAINNHTFKNDKKVVSLEIPEGVTSIGDWVFEHMDAMTSLTLPSTLTKIGDGSFGWIGAMKTLTIKAAVPPTVVSGTFRDFPFSTCKLIVPTGAKANYQGTLFNQFTTIEEADFGTITPPAPLFPADGLTLNGLTYTLNDDSKTVSVKVADKNSAFEAVIPASVTYENKSFAVTTIAQNGFQGSKITKVEIPASVTTISNGAFKEAKSLTSVVIPASVETLGKEAFRYCQNLLTVTFEGTAIKAINDHTFNNCWAIAELEIPEGVTTIGDWVFERMNAMTTLTLPSTLTKVGDGSFGWISKMETMTVKATTPPTLSGTPFRDFPYSTCKLIVPNGSKSAYQAANGFSAFTTIEEADFGGGGVVTPPAPSFPENGVISNGLVYTLNEDGETLSVKIADKNASIQAIILAEITYLQKDYKVTAIANNGFQQSNITKIEIPNTVTSIGSSAFENAKKFTSIVIPKSVTTIGNGAFQWAEGLETITFEAGSALKAINNHTFKGCKKVKKMVLPEGITTIGEWVFENMEALTVMELPSTLTTIGSGSFQRCAAMMALTSKATTPPAANGNVFDNFPVSSCNL